MKFFCELWMILIAACLLACTDYVADIDDAHEKYVSANNLTPQTPTERDPGVLWDGTIHEHRVITGHDAGLGSSGYWYDFTDEQSFFTWPVPKDDDSITFLPIIEACGGMCGTVSLVVGSSGDDAYVGIAFQVAGDNRPADISDWGGLCISYSSDLTITLLMGFGEVMDEFICWDRPMVKLVPGTEIKACYAWTDFKLRNWGCKHKMPVEDAIKSVAYLNFEFNDTVDRTGSFNITRIAKYGY